MLRGEVSLRTRFTSRKDGDQMPAFRQGPPWIRQAGKDGTRNPSCRLNGGIWRPRPESNRRTRICSPLHNHSATRPLPEPPRLICRKRRLEREALVIDKGRTAVKNRVMVFNFILSMPPIRGLSRSGRADIKPPGGTGFARASHRFFPSARSRRNRMSAADARRNMIDRQLRDNQIDDERLLAAMAAIPRECFVAGSALAAAYADANADQGEGRFLMAPLCFARLVQEAHIKTGDMVLDIGCGTGYSSAVLSHLAGSVVAVEENDALRERAACLLGELGVDNVVLTGGFHAQGDAAHAPYDVILIEGCVPAPSEALCAQLAEGGRLLAVTGASESSGRGLILHRLNDRFVSRTLFDAAPPFLPGMQLGRTFIL